MTSTISEIGKKHIADHHEETRDDDVADRGGEIIFVIPKSQGLSRLFVERFTC